ncbi:hypothetical protein [Inhella sp.]|uniref:hypothetical protein n=1 Tax=Inhella sp. TaxID=1921806 RepID=UPI0035B3AFD2
MTQNREPPAFQEYAATMLARMEFRIMSLLGRGLLYTLRLECWHNGKASAKPDTLARLYGATREEIDAALQELQPFFTSDGEWLRCPELDDYRRHLEERRERQSQGGRKGAELTNATRKPAPSRHRLAATPSGESRGRRGSLVKPSPVQHSKDQTNTASNEEESFEEWVAGYDKASLG